MWDMKSTKYEKERMAILDAGWEPFAVTERNSDGYGHQEPVYYFRFWKTDKPEGQKIQDEWKTKLKEEQAYKHIAEKLDCEVLTPLEQAAIRAQAIKDVARWLRIREISAYITGYHMKSLENGKIPE